MNDLISPKYLMKVIESVESSIWAEYASYEKVRFYIEKWHQSDEWEWQNFRIVSMSNGKIDLGKTLHNMNGELLLKIAIDIGVETPDFIPAITVIKNELKENSKTAFESFQRAFKLVEENPSLAVGLANSTLESIIKEILNDDRLSKKLDVSKTLYSLTMDILKEFKIYPDSSLPVEIKNIGSSLLNITQNIEKIRSEKTIFHGKTNQDYLIQDSLYAYFIVNSVSTVGLFLKSYYKTKFPKPEDTKPTVKDDLDDLPF